MAQLLVHRPRSPYKPLKQNEIRLLKLESLPDLKFSFKTINIDDPKDYVALSYCWGKRHSGRFVYVDGCALSISQGLLECLTRFQRGFRDKSIHPWKEYLWIDALCINQNDLKIEKPSQVALMSRIYEEANEVFVWLGEAPDAEVNKLAVQKLKAIGKGFVKATMKGHKSYPWWWPRKPTDLNGPSAQWIASIAQEEFQGLKNPAGPTKMAWMGINAIMKSPWWHRTWVYQESTVEVDWKMVKFYATFEKGSSGTISFGEETFTWLPDMSTMKRVADKVNLFKELDKTIFEGGAYRELGQMLGLKVDRTEYKNKTILEAVHGLRSTLCTDPRDKIFAAFGLCSDRSKLIVQPNYDVQVEQLYTSFAAKLIEMADHELDVLGYVQKPLETQTRATPKLALSSWVPDWTLDQRLFPLAKQLLLKDEHFQDRRKIRPFARMSMMEDVIGRRPVYGASQGIWAAKPVAHGHALVVNGVYIDIIEDLYPYTSTRDFARQKMAGWVTKINSEGGYFTKEPMKEVIGRTQATDVEIDTALRPIKRGGIFDAKLNQKDPLQLPPADQHLRYLNLERLAKATRCRAISLTRKHYLGLVPDSSKPGDLICAFAGGQVLYVIRRNHSSRDFEYIGESYVHGMMDGAAAGLLQSGISPLTQFVIV